MQRRRSARVRHRHHVGGILHEHAGVAMVGVIVVRARRHHQVGIPKRIWRMICAHVQRRQQLAVVVVEHHVVDADAAPARRLGAAARRERPAALGWWPGVAVGHRDEPHLMAGPRTSPPCRRRVKSQSSGCAPKAMMLSLPSVARCLGARGAACSNPLPQAG